MNSLKNTTHESTAVDLREVAFIALGSNLPSDYGSPLESLRRAMAHLKDISQGQVSCSSIWQSEPEDCPDDSPDFVNAMIGILLQDNESPASLLDKLKELESRFGRQRSAVPNQPRTLDLDLITYGNRQIDEEDLTVPHPRAFSRAFVLFPFEEIAPDLVAPGQTRSISELAAKLRLGMDQMATKITKLDSAGY